MQPTFQQQTLQQLTFKQLVFQQQTLQQRAIQHQIFQHFHPLFSLQLSPLQKLLFFLLQLRLIQCHLRSQWCLRLFCQQKLLLLVKPLRFQHFKSQLLSFQHPFQPPLLQLASTLFPTVIFVLRMLLCLT